MDPSRMYERGLNVWGLRSVMLCSPLPSGYSQPGWVAKGWNVVIQEVTGGVQQGLTLGHWSRDRRTLGGAFWAQVWDTKNFGTPLERARAAAPGWQGVNLKDRRSNFRLTVNWSPHSFGHHNVQTLLVAQPSHNRKSTHFSTTALLQERYIFCA